MLRRAGLLKSRWLRAAPVPLWLVALGAVLATLGCSCSNARGDRPNVIFIVTDDQAFSTLPHMPHVRRELSEAGVTLENFILNDPICCPSRVTILLGQYRHNHRLELGIPGGCAFRFFEDHEQQRAIGPVIQTAGYRTGIIGKYLNSYRKYLSRIATTEGIPKLPGWDDYHILASPSDYYDFFMDENGKLVAYTQKTQKTQKTGKTGKWPVYQTDLLTRLARNFIETSADKGSPFFLYLATRTPHEPATPARRHLRSARGLKAPRGPTFNQADVSLQPSLRKAPRLRPGRSRRSTSAFAGTSKRSAP